MAIRCLEKAIALDGSFPQASAALADCHSILMDYGMVSPAEGLTAARLASGRALHQGPELAESLTAAALVRQMSLDWGGAEAEFEAVVRTHPDYPIARQRYALLLAYLGRDSESRRQIEGALALDPGSPAAAASEAWIEYYRGRTERAIEIGRNAVLRHPRFSSAEVVLSLSLTAAERPQEGAGVLERALARETDNVSLLSLLSYIRAQEGNRGEAERLIARLRSWSRERYVSPYYLAVPYVGLDRWDEAWAALRVALAERVPQLVYLGREPVFQSFRKKPRFQALLSHIGLPRRAAPGTSTLLNLASWAEAPR
jgi:tetratricopeptide (TPR) repeat protein